MIFYFFNYLIICNFETQSIHPTSLLSLKALTILYIYIIIMEDKFKYDTEGQLAAILYLRTIGTISSVTDYNGHVDNINAVVYANQLYNKMNPEPDKHKISYYELHGEEQPSKGALEEEIRRDYTKMTDEEVKQYINDTFYGGKDGSV